MSVYVCGCADCSIEALYVAHVFSCVFGMCLCTCVWESDRFHAVAEQGHVPGHLEDITHSLKLPSCEEEYRSTTAHSRKTERELLLELLLTKL